MKLGVLLLLVCMTLGYTESESPPCNADVRDIEEIRKILTTIKAGKYFPVTVKPTSSGKCKSKVRNVLIKLRKFSRKHKLVMSNFVTSEEFSALKIECEKKLKELKDSLEEARPGLTGNSQEVIAMLNKEIDSLNVERLALEGKLTAISKKLQQVRKDLCIVKLQNNDLAYAVDTFNKMLPKDLEEIISICVDKTVHFDTILQFAFGITDLDIRLEAMNTVYRKTSRGALFTSLSTILLNKALWDIFGSSDMVDHEWFVDVHQQRTVKTMLEAMSKQSAKVFDQWSHDMCVPYYYANVKHSLEFMSPDLTYKLGAALVGSMQEVQQNCLLDILHSSGRCSIVGAYVALLETTSLKYLAPIVFKLQELRKVCESEKNNEIKEEAESFLSSIGEVVLSSMSLQSIMNCSDNLQFHSPDSASCIRISTEKVIINWGEFHPVCADSPKTGCSSFSLELLERDGLRFKIREKITGNTLTHINSVPSWGNEFHFLAADYTNKPRMKLDTDDGLFLESHGLTNNTLFIGNEFDIPTATRTTNYCARIRHGEIVYVNVYRWAESHFMKSKYVTDGHWEVRCAQKSS